jgi:hypothetical protein
VPPLEQRDRTCGQTKTFSICRSGMLCEFITAVMNPFAHHPKCPVNKEVKTKQANKYRSARTSVKGL